MNGSIVVGTDGSDTASRALDVAITMAKTFAQPLHIVGAYRVPPDTGDVLPIEMTTSVNPHEVVNSVLAEAAELARRSGVEATTHVKTGNPADAILAVAKEVSADLIVVGNRGVKSKARFVMGNVPSRVVHHAPCSTYVVHTS